VRFEADHAQRVNESRLPALRNPAARFEFRFCFRLPQHTVARRTGKIRLAIGRGPRQSVLELYFPNLRAELFAFRGWAAGTLLGGDGFDDELAAGFRIDWDLRTVERGVHQVEDFGIVEDAGRHESNMANEIAPAFEAVVGIGNARALQEAERDMIRHEQDGKNGERGLVGGAEADDEAVVIVIDHFGGAGQALAHFG
jgi:hypothetical protein